YAGHRDLHSFPTRRSSDLNEPGTDHGQSGGYLGNLEHTAVIDALLRVPRAERGEEWIVNFLSHVATASFRCGDPQIIQGPDGFRSEEHTSELQSRENLVCR